MGRIRTDAEGLDEAIIELRKEPMSCRAVAELLGIPEWRVADCMRRHGLQGKYRAPKNEPRRREGQPSKGIKRDASLPEVVEELREMRVGVAEASGEMDLRIKRMARVVRELAAAAGIDASLVE